ncbi:MAG TPA: hypothetical protein P5158_08035 [Chitinophagaceae bacterium]|nr:hypothetical protein [Chitinophagaceae bacterium]HRX94048.1 hypothetical protein [Chitinophagaceae bacterium]
MNRRSFITRSGALSLAVAGLPAALGRKKQKTKDVYRFAPDMSKPGQTAYVLSLYHDGIKNFSLAAEEDKKILLAAHHYEKANMADIGKHFEYSFKMSAAGIDTKYPDTWIVRTTGREKLSGSFEWPSQLSANPELRIKIGRTAELRTTNDDKFATLYYQEQNSYSDDDEDCFITTACVTEKGLPDNCYELESLRMLRENYMRKTKQGRDLLKEYETLGPNVVSAIALYSNRSEIYDYLYQHMITPALRLIREGKPQQAVDWYAAFATEIERKYC